MPLADLAGSAEEAAEMALIIARLFDASNALQTSIDAPSFRVENEYLIPTIDRLEQTPFLKREGDEYRLGIVALTEVNDERAKTLLADCERILSLLRAHYRNKETRKAPKRLVEIAQELGLPIERVLSCVELLKDISWMWSSGWNNPPATISERFVSVSESILRYKSMAEVFEHLNKTVGAHARDRRALYERVMQNSTSKDESTMQNSTPKTKEARKVFVVHGHDDGPREAACRVLEKLGLVPVVLFEQPNEGQTIVEKFEKHASDADFAVVILTPDDTGYPAGEQMKARSRARQNVVLELGYFAGKLQRRNIVVLHKGEVELPSDYHGVLYVPIDAHGAWKWRLAAEIKKAGIEVDLNNVA